MTSTVRPVLASTLLEASRSTKRPSDQLREHAGVRHSTKRRRLGDLKTGHGTVDDDVLNGGLSYGGGGVVGVACEETRVGVELAYSTLTSHLLDYRRSQAYYIDTSKTFEPRVLHNKLVARLEAKRSKPLHDGGFVYHKPSEGQVKALAEDSQDADKTAMAALDRISMMRVFDLEGLMDAVMEVRARLQEQESKPEPITRGDSLVSQNHHVGAQTLHHDGTEAANHDSRRSKTLAARPEQTKEVADSQASSDMSDLESEPSEIDGDDDMLLDLPDHEVGFAPIFEGPKTTVKQLPPVDEAPTSGGPYLLVMPSPARTLSSCMHTNHIRTHALLVHLMRTLQRLTRTHAISVLLINTTVERAISTASGREHGPSAFSSNVRLKPALGKTWDWYLDLSCMISTTFEPQHEKEDMAQREDGKQQCFEVLTDRYGCRVGRWAVMRL